MGVDQYVETEIEAMQSGENLQVVVEILHLGVRWGVADSQAVEELRKGIRVERLGEGRMIELIYRHRMKEDAQSVCEAFCKAYAHRKSALHRQREELNLMGVKNDLHIAENKYEELALEYSHVNGTYQGDLEWIGVKRSLQVVKKDYEEALKIKNELAGELKELRRKVISPIQVMIVHEEPEMQHFAVSPNVRLNQAMGLMGGLFMAGMIGGVLLIVSLIDRKQRR